MTRRWVRKEQLTAKFVVYAYALRRLLECLDLPVQAIDAVLLGLVQPHDTFSRQVQRYLRGTKATSAQVARVFFRRYEIVEQQPSFLLFGPLLTIALEQPGNLRRAIISKALCPTCVYYHKECQKGDLFAAHVTCTRYCGVIKPSLYPMILGNVERLQRAYGRKNWKIAARH